MTFSDKTVVIHDDTMKHTCPSKIFLTHTGMIKKLTTNDRRSIFLRQLTD